MKGQYTLKSIYKSYTEEVPHTQQVTKDQFHDVNKLFVEKALDKILNEAERVKFPIIGSFRIKKFKQDYTKRLYVDHKRTKELGIKTYHLNEDRGGYIYRYYWHKKGVHKHIDLYPWSAARYSVRRKLPKFLQENPNKDFFE
jgi:hypothetical protein